jgi:biopolymer transport protein ExbD
MIKKRKQSRGVIPVASMGDIAFLLLIFFMISSIAEAEKEIQVLLPEARMAIEEKNKFFNLYVKKNEADQIEYYYGFDKCDFDNLTLLTNYARTKLLNLNPEQMPEFRALIRSDKDIPYRYINGAMSAIKEAGVYNIMLVTEKPAK